MRLPFLIQDYLGINMEYYIMKSVPINILKFKMRSAVKNKDLATVKHLIFTGECKIDDPIDVYSQHTILHDAVTLNREDIFEFLVKSNANLDIKDMND